MHSVWKSFKKVSSSEKFQVSTNFNFPLFEGKKFEKIQIWFFGLKMRHFCWFSTTVQIFDESFSLKELILEMRISHHWVDSRLNTTYLEETIELEPDAVTEFWVPDSYFHHAHKAKTVRIMNPTASLQVTPNQTIRYTEL